MEAKDGWKFLLSRKHAFVGQTMWEDFLKIQEVDSKLIEKYFPVASLQKYSVLLFCFVVESVWRFAASSFVNILEKVHAVFKDYYQPLKSASFFAGSMNWTTEEENNLLHKKKDKHIFEELLLEYLETISMYFSHTTLFCCYLFLILFIHTLLCGSDIQYIIHKCIASCTGIHKWQTSLSTD